MHNSEYRRPKEAHWASYPMLLLERLIRDFRQASRRLRRNPGFTAILVCILGLGIGANTAVFSVVETALFSPPLPYANPDQTVRIYITRAKGDRTEWLTHPEYAELRSSPGLFSYTAAASDIEIWSLQKDSGTFTVLGEIWSASLFFAGPGCAR